MYNTISELNVNIPNEQILKTMLGGFYEELTFANLTPIWLISSIYICRIYADFIKSRVGIG